MRPAVGFVTSTELTTCRDDQSVDMDNLAPTASGTDRKRRLPIIRQGSTVSDRNRDLERSTAQGKSRLSETGLPRCR